MSGRNEDLKKFRAVAGQEQFFRFNWMYLPGLIFATAAAWVSQGPVFVVVVVAVAAVVIGVYYAVWRWVKDRSA